VKFKESDFAHLDLEAELQAAFKVLHTKLEPLERAAYVLKEAFDFDYEAIQHVLNKKADHCRQLFCRAKKKLRDEAPKLHIEFPNKAQLIESFKKACEGPATHFIQELKSDISAKFSNKA
jgi:RNA polymerase sigma-70 factor (ECF subfamily)